MKRIGFRADHVDPIVAGEKTLTVRYDFERAVDEGDLIDLRTTTGDVFARAKVVLSKRMLARDFVRFVDVFGGHKSYADVDEFADALADYYDPPREGFSEFTIVTAIGFDVVETFDETEGEAIVANGPVDLDVQQAADILGVSPDSPDRVIKTAYQEQTKTAHPDVGGSSAELQRVTEAKEVLLSDE
jgi:hypothetical protein